jgi:hypothetical protein
MAEVSDNPLVSIHIPPLAPWSPKEELGGALEEEAVG